jgi:hypothetical protein
MSDLLSCSDDFGVSVCTTLHYKAKAYGAFLLLFHRTFAVLVLLLVAASLAGTVLYLQVMKFRDDHHSGCGLSWACSPYACALLHFMERGHSWSN